MSDNIQSLLYLRDKLRQFQIYKKNNPLDFWEVDKYREQNDIYLQMQDRLAAKRGAKIFVVWAGNRAGKTELGAGVCCRAMEEYPGIRIACATIETKLSIQVQQRKISKLLRKSIVKYGEYNPERGFKNNIVTGQGDQSLLFRTYAQGREAIQGDDVDLWWLDEEPPWDFFQEALARTADRNGILLLTFTPLLGYTKLVNFLLNEQNKYIRRYNLSILLNPFISNEAKQDWIANVDPDEIISRVDGKPNLKEGLVYKEFNDIHLIERFEYTQLAKLNPGRWEISEGIDPHERVKHHWLRFLYDKENDALYVVEELQASKESEIISDFARRIKLARKGITPSYTQIDTSSMKPDIITKHVDEYQVDNNTVRKEFDRNGISTILVVKDNALGIGLVKERLKVVKLPNGEIKRMPKLYVFSDLAGFRFEINRYSWKKYESNKAAEGKELLNEVNKKEDHYMDILKYECIKRGAKKEVKQEHSLEQIMIERIGY